jgi:hypothetical protein
LRFTRAKRLTAPLDGKDGVRDGGDEACFVPLV